MKADSMKPSAIASVATTPSTQPREKSKTDYRLAEAEPAKPAENSSPTQDVTTLSKSESAPAVAGEKDKVEDLSKDLQGRTAGVAVTEVEPTVVAPADN